MDDKNVKLFENKRIHTAWDAEKQAWLFSVVDVVSVLTESAYAAKCQRLLGSYEKSFEG